MRNPPQAENTTHSNKMPTFTGNLKSFLLKNDAIVSRSDETEEDIANAEHGSDDMDR